jgi:hypothetical protein
MRNPRVADFPIAVASASALIRINAAQFPDRAPANAEIAKTIDRRSSSGSHLPASSMMDDDGPPAGFEPSYRNPVIRSAAGLLGSPGPLNVNACS